MDRVTLLLLGALVFIPAATSTPAYAEPVAATDTALDRWQDFIAEASRRFGVPEAWIRAVMQAESGGRTMLDGRPITSRTGAMGLMQVMPATWAGLRTRYGLGPDPFEPRDNILAGAAYLREMYDRYGDLGAMLAAYNAGPDRADDYLASGRPLPAETRSYVATIASALGAGPVVAGAMPRVHMPDWREAPLFITLGSDAPDAATTRTDGAASEALVAQGDASATTQPGIFVAVSTDGAHR